MPATSSILTLATAVAGASAAFQGFNYDNKGKNQQTFEAEFKNAQGLEGTNGGFTSARLYTMIQDGTESDPISAIPAGISTKTSLLLGLWASGGQTQFNNELAALSKTIDQYCGQLDGLIAGISVGSEDLYRDSPVGQAAGENPGVGPDVLSSYVDQTRKVIKGSCLESAPIGHVDTWTAYANQTNRDFSNKLDWVGMDAYPYYENQKPNGIENAKQLFQTAIDNTNAGTGNKPLWITETGWPVSGKTENLALAGTDNAQTFWREVGCPRFGNVNIWWYTQQDGGPSTSSNPSFGVVGASLSTTPLYDLSCEGYENGGSSSSSSSSASGSSATEKPTSSATGSKTESSSAASTTCTSEGSTGAASSGAASTLSTSATPCTSVPASTGPASSVAAGTGTQASETQPAAGSSTNGGSVSTSSPSASTVPVTTNSAAGLNSVCAAVAALLMAVAAF